MARSPYLTIGIPIVLFFSILAGGLFATFAPASAASFSPILDSVSGAQQQTPVVMDEAAELPPASSLTPTPTHPVTAASFHPGDSVKLDLISMKSRSEGWGLSGGYVLTTVDGGTSWHDVTPSFSSPPGTKSRAYGAFLDARTAWIIYAEDEHISPEAFVWHTSDGGVNWTPGRALNHQAFGDRVWAEFAVLDGKNLWLLVRGVYVGAGTHFDHELFRSTDGGLTWTALPDDSSDDYTGMVFADIHTGLRTLQTAGASAAAPPAYESTSDGGAAWENRELPLPPGVPDLFLRYPYCETYQPVMLSPKSIRMLVGCFEYGDPPRKFISYFYSSQDGGATWQTVLLPAKVQAAQNQLIYFGLNKALLLSRDIYLSISDGQTWTFVKTVNWDGQFTFCDPLYGWAIARSKGEVALVKTIDGGATWIIIKPIIAR